MGAILIHQLRDNIYSLRFQVSLVILLVFFAANGVIYAMKMDRLLAEDASIEAHDEGRYDRGETVRDAADNWYRILSPATGTEFITEAGFNWFGHAMWLSPRTGMVPEGTDTVRSTNHLMRRFEVVDWTFVVRYVLSFLCIVLAYNAVSGEREAGTLSQVLANSLSRGRFLMGKFLAHLITLLVATLVGIVISLLILSLSGMVELNAPIGRACLLFLLGTLLYTSFFLLLGIGVSALSRSSASSLIVLITAWTALIVVIPHSSYLIAVRAEESASGIWDQMWGVRNETFANLEREGISPRQADHAREDNYELEKRYAARLRDMEKELERMSKAAEQQQLRQYRLAWTVNLISPGFALQYTVEALLGAGVRRYENFVEQGWRYREGLREFIRARDAADPESPNILFLPNYMSAKKLDPNQIPRFSEQRLTFAQGVAGSVAPITILVLEAGLAFFFALLAFNRADILLR